MAPLRLSIQESGREQLLEEELHVGQLAVPNDAQVLQHGPVHRLNGHENAPQMIYVASHQVQGFSKVVDCFAHCLRMSTRDVGAQIIVW